VPLTTTPAPLSVLILLLPFVLALPESCEFFLTKGSGQADLSLQTLLQHLRLSAHSETTYYPRQSIFTEFTQLLLG